MAKYAVSDLHSQVCLYNQIKNFLKPEDVVYVLGDCGDRGEDGWDLIKMVYNDPQFIYLKGNHEDMLINAAYGDVAGCFRNGGRPTYKALFNDPDRDEWLNKLQALPLCVKYTNSQGQKVYLSHAGFTPGCFVYTRDEDYLWDRTHFNEPWDEERYADTVIVHGHTPMQLMPNGPREITGAYFYCGGHKVDIDCASWVSGRTVLLDLDTWEEHLFDEFDYSKEA